MVLENKQEVQLFLTTSSASPGHLPELTQSAHFCLFLTFSLFWYQAKIEAACPDPLGFPFSGASPLQAPADLHHGASGTLTKKGMASLFPGSLLPAAVRFTASLPCCFSPKNLIQ